MQLIKRQLNYCRVNKILVSRCMGDIRQADRLIQFELKKDPSQSRAQATRAAIARWERDNSELSYCF
jgi:Tfp pilus assembly protein PilF